MLQSIPTVDLDALRASDPRALDILGKAFHDIGFLYVREERISKLLPSAYESMKKVFSLPEEVKLSYADDTNFYQRGYTPPFTEMGIACSATNQADAKENWFIGPDLADDHPIVLAYPQIYAPNVWPSEVGEFKPLMLELYDATYDCGKEVMHAVGNYFGKPHSYFDEIMRDSSTVMRPLHYPPVTEEQVGKIVWGCQHTDINLVTILPRAGNGLWVRRRDGVWIPGVAPEDCVLAQVGDELEQQTGGYMMSAAHEVRAPNKATTEGRLSLAQFVHARSDYILRPELEPKIVDAEYLQKLSMYKPVTAGEFLTERLKNIKLAKLKRN